MAKHKWTDEYLEKISEWREKNSSSWAEAAAHFGESTKAIIVAISKRKKRQVLPVAADRPRRKYRRQRVKHVQPVEIEVQDVPKPQPRVAMLILSPKQVQEILGGLWQ